MQLVTFLTPIVLLVYAYPYPLPNPTLLNAHSNSRKPKPSHLGRQTQAQPTAAHSSIPSPPPKNHSPTQLSHPPCPQLAQTVHLLPFPNAPQITHPLAPQSEHHPPPLPPTARPQTPQLKSTATFHMPSSSPATLRTCAARSGRSMMRVRCAV